MVDQLSLDSYILKHWRAGRDTLEIAKLLQLREHVVANRLWHIRDMGKCQQTSSG